MADSSQTTPGEEEERLNSQFGTTREYKRRFDAGDIRGSRRTETLGAFVEGADSIRSFRQRHRREPGVPTLRDRYGVTAKTVLRPSSYAIRKQVKADGGLTPKTALLAWEHACYEMYSHARSINPFVSMDFEKHFARATGQPLNQASVQHLIGALSHRTSAIRLGLANQALKAAYSHQHALAVRSLASFRGDLRWTMLSKIDELQLRRIISVNDSMIDQHYRLSMSFQVGKGMSLIGAGIGKIVDKSLDYVEYRRLHDEVLRQRKFADAEARRRMWAEANPDDETIIHEDIPSAGNKQKERTEFDPDLVAKTKNLQDALFEDITKMKLEGQELKDFLDKLNRGAQGPLLNDDPETLERRRIWQAAVAGVSKHFGVDSEFDDSVPFTPPPPGPEDRQPAVRPEQSNWDVLGAEEGDMDGAQRNFRQESKRLHHEMGGVDVKTEDNAAAWERLQDINYAWGQLKALRLAENEAAEERLAAMAEDDLATADTTFDEPDVGVDETPRTTEASDFYYDPFADGTAFQPSGQRQSSPTEPALDRATEPETRPTPANVDPGPGKFTTSNEAHSVITGDPDARLDPGPGKFTTSNESHEYLTGDPDSQSTRVDEAPRLAEQQHWDLLGATTGDYRQAVANGEASIRALDEYRSSQGTNPIIDERASDIQKALNAVRTDQVQIQKQEAIDAHDFDRMDQLGRTGFDPEVDNDTPSHPGALDSNAIDDWRTQQPDLRQPAPGNNPERNLDGDGFDFGGR
jgi:hypothetical protein